MLALVVTVATKDVLADIDGAEKTRSAHSAASTTGAVGWSALSWIS
jgi:hypothetical protein